MLAPSTSVYSYPSAQGQKIIGLVTCPEIEDHDVLSPRALLILVLTNDKAGIEANGFGQGVTGSKGGTGKGVGLATDGAGVVIPR
jgi:hypothetical protein